MNKIVYKSIIVLSTLLITPIFAFSGTDPHSSSNHAVTLKCKEKYEKHELSAVCSKKEDAMGACTSVDLMDLTKTATGNNARLIKTIDLSKLQEISVKNNDF